MLPSNPAPLAEWTPVEPEYSSAPVRAPEATVRPRGTPLTDVQGFFDAGGTPWVAYIEGTPPPERGWFGTRTVMPGRHLRFDSPGSSRITGVVPAGAPFLSPARLAGLLGEAGPFPPPAVVAPPALAERLRAAVVRLWARLGPMVRTWASGRTLHAALAVRHRVFH